jgi:Ubiquitin-2 like Rad60 SUMO-like
MSKPSAAPRQNTVVIELGDDDSDGPRANTVIRETHTTRATSEIRKETPTPPSPSKAQAHPEPESEDSEEDEYLRALKQKARERARLQRLASNQQKPPAAPSPGNDARSPSIGQTHPYSASSPDQTANQHTDPFDQSKATVDEDAEVAILIKSLIPNSKPLVVNRKASQPLQQVKDFWCARQSFEPSFAAKVFFTWRGTKLFNSSTMRTVLRQLKKERGCDPEGSDDPSKGKITLEAMTQEIYDDRQRAKERKAAAVANSENASEADGTEEAPTPAPEPPKIPGIIVKLTSQGLEPMPLRVRPHTSIDKIMRAFQGQRGIDRDKTCWLVFDGDRLAKERSVKDVGFEDGDEIEVYPR